MGSLPGIVGKHHRSATHDHQLDEFAVIQRQVAQSVQCVFDLQAS